MEIIRPGAMVPLQTPVTSILEVDRAHQALVRAQEVDHQALHPVEEAQNQLVVRQEDSN